MLDTPEASSGLGSEVHFPEGLTPLRYGAWARGTFEPNRGFRLVDTFGAFVIPTRFDPVARSTTGSAAYVGSYSSYVQRDGYGTSHLVGEAGLAAFWSKTSGAVDVTLYSPNLARSTFSPELEAAQAAEGESVRPRNLLVGNLFMGAPIQADETFGRRVTDGISGVVIYTDSQSGLLYSPGQSSAGGLFGEFFGVGPAEAVATYYFTVGRTTAVGAFGTELR